MNILCLVLFYSTFFPLVLTNNTEQQTTTATTVNIDILKEKIRDIGYYLRDYKFNEYDRRYETNSTTADRIYFKHFPRPPLRALHWEVHRFCESSFMDCVDYLAKKVRGASARRNDDTSVVMKEQKWTWKKNEDQITQVDQECKKNKRIDNILADPFEGPLERYQWRVTASYYMCWYTLLQVPELSRFYEKCDNFANCLDYAFGPNNDDERVSDYQNLSCALYSFCPDPCCPFKHLKRMKDCWDSPENPCFIQNSKGKRTCSVIMTNNIEFSNIILNRWNVTCRCPQQRGYEWNSRYGICIDVDECLSRTHNCKPKIESCLNLPGSFRCICHWGYIWNEKENECLPSKALAVLKLKRKDTTKVIKNLSTWQKFKNVLFRRNNCSLIKINLVLIVLQILINIINVI